MLVGIIALYYLHLQQTGQGTFDYVVLLNSLTTNALVLPHDTAVLIFFAFALAFSIKVPLFPLHTWLPDAHTEAPTAGSVILAAVLLKMGTYGILRFCFGLFPEIARTEWVASLFIALAVIGIIYGALVAMVQPDIKRLVAYSSVSHMGFVMLGMFSFNEMGMQGALYQMLNHGVSTGALFLLVGMIYDRRHTRAISEYGGLANVMPLYATFFVITVMSSIGLPFLNGFVGEFLTMLGMWTSNAITWNWAATMLAGTGVILAAVYLLWMLQRFLFGKITNEKNRFLSDLNAREIGLLVPLLILMVVMGVYPKPFLNRSRESIVAVEKRLGNRPAGGTISEINESHR
jgi:NADH-quinone oxidoreductase subunit M